MARKVLLLGSTGYVGGELLHQLLESKHHLFEITALVRSKAQADRLPVACVIGSLDSTEILLEESQKADIIINAANADHRGIFTILEGAREDAIVIHLSGAGNLIDPELKGGTNSSAIVSDRDRQAIQSLPATRFHVPIERELFKTRKKLIVLSPGVILGNSRGLTSDSNFTSAVYNAFVRHGSVFQVEGGLNAWGWTSVGDVARAVTFVMEKASKGAFSSEEVPYCFVGTGEVTFHERAIHAASRLKKEGVLSTDQIQDYNWEEYLKLDFGPVVKAVATTSSRYRADLLDDLGFRPEDRDWRLLVEQGKSV